MHVQCQWPIIDIRNLKSKGDIENEIKKTQPQALYIANRSNLVARSMQISLYKTRIMCRHLMCYYFSPPFNRRYSDSQISLFIDDTNHVNDDDNDAEMLSFRYTQSDHISFLSIFFAKAIEQNSIVCSRQLKLFPSPHQMEFEGSAACVFANALDNFKNVASVFLLVACSA